MMTSPPSLAVDNITPLEHESADEESSLPPALPSVLKGADNIATMAAAAFSLVVGLSYLLGFIVVNGALSQVQLLNQDLLEGRYLATGLSFLLLSLVPAVVATLLALEVTNKSAREFVPRLKRLAFPISLIGCWFSVIMVFSVDHSLAMVQNIILFGSSIGFASAGITLKAVVVKERIQKALQGKPERFPSVLVHLLAAKGMLLTIPLIFLGSMFAHVFGSTVYPSISPTFGGGAVWMAKITLRSSSNIGPSKDLLTQSVILIEHDESFFKMASCVPSRDGFDLVSIYIPVAEIASIRLASIVPLPVHKKKEEQATCEILSKEDRPSLGVPSTGRPTPALQRATGAAAERP